MAENSLHTITKDAELRDMARRSFGYGCWNAPYWFIGPEQGQSRHEQDDLTDRLNAWKDFGCRDLDDCRKCHHYLGVNTWHRPTPRLQPTWRPLILLLMVFKGKDSDNEALRRYHRDEWGSLNGETCVIELSGLAAHDLRVPRDRDSWICERVAFIREQILSNKPRVVVMYGTGSDRAWNAIAAPETLVLGNAACHLGTLFVMVPHPASRRFKNEDWRRIGADLRRKSEIVQQGL